MSSLKHIYLDNFFFVAPVLSSLRQNGICDTFREGYIPNRDSNGNFIYTFNSFSMKLPSNSDFLPILGTDLKEKINKHFKFYISVYSMIEMIKVYEKESNIKVNEALFSRFVLNSLQLYLPNVQMIPIDPDLRLTKATYLKSEKDHEDSLHLKVAMDNQLWFVADSKFYKRYNSIVSTFYDKLMNVEMLNYEFKELNIPVKYDYELQNIVRYK